MEVVIPASSGSRNETFAPSGNTSSARFPASIQVRDGAWYPVLEGNATVVYRAEVDLRGGQLGPIDWATEENAAYRSLDAGNTDYLKSRGVLTAHP